jgi:Na+/melibiose symporter-like transporter
MAVMSALFFFYVDFYFCRDVTAAGEGNAVGLIGAALMFGMQIVALPVYTALMKTYGKTAVYIIGSVIWIAGALFLFIVPPNAPSWVLYVLAAVLGFGISAPGLVPHALLPDVIDAGHLQFGRRDAGSFSGVANMSVQIAQAAGVALAMALIGMAGFIEQDISEGAQKVVAQSESAQNAVILIMALTPLVCMSVGIFTCTRDRLDKETHARLIGAIEGGREEREAVLKSL